MPEIIIKKRLKAGGYDDLDAEITAFKKFYIEDMLKEIAQEELSGIFLN